MKAAAQARPAMQVSPAFLAQIRLRSNVHRAEAFAPYRPPPGVLPKNRSAMAMDEASGWRPDDLSTFYEGQAFMGYPYLAELGQRPEYRVICEAIADEMTRKWIVFQATGESDKSDKIKLIEGEWTRLKVRDVFNKAARHDALFGMAHIYIEVGQPMDKELATPLGGAGPSRLKVARNSLRAIRTVEPVWTYPATYNSTDPLSADWYRPKSWFVMGREVHRSRLMTMVGREVSDLLKPSYNFGGVSMTQMAKPYVDNWLNTRQNVSEAVRVFSTSVLKTDMQRVLTGGDDPDFIRRIGMFTTFRSNDGVLAIDKETEDFAEVSKSLSTLDALQAQSQEHMASVCRIPLVKLLGVSPTGLNASSDGEIRVWEDNIMGAQEALFRGPLEHLLRITQLSMFGAIDSEITIKFAPLHEMTELERAQIDKQKADIHNVYVDMGVIAPEEVRAALVNDSNSPYAGLDPDQMPETPEQTPETPLEGRDPEEIEA